MIRNVILVLFLTLAFVACQKNENDQTTFQVHTIAEGDLEISISADGQISTVQDIEIKCKASGEVIYLPFDIGDRITKGDLLLELDPSNEKRNLDSAKISLALAEIELESSQLQYKIAQKKLSIGRRNREISLTSAQTRANRATLNHTRLSRLLEQNLSSQETVETAFAEMIDAVSNLQKVELQAQELDIEELSLTFRQQDIKKAESTLALRKLQLSDAEQRLADTKIFAPANGVISARNIQTGQIIASGISNVTGGTTVMLLSDTSKLYVNAEIDESEIGCISVGQAAKFTVEAFPFQGFTGIIERIGVKGISRSQVVFFNIRVAVDDIAEQILKAGMSASLQIEVATHNNVLLIPYGAIVRESDGQSFSYVGESLESAQKEKIELGLCAENCAVLSGLKKGDQVLIPLEPEDDVWRGSLNKKQNDSKVKIRIKR